MLKLVLFAYVHASNSYIPSNCICSLGVVIVVGNAKTYNVNNHLFIHINKCTSLNEQEKCIHSTHTHTHIDTLFCRHWLHGFSAGVSVAAVTVATHCYSLTLHNHALFFCSSAFRLHRSLKYQASSSTILRTTKIPCKVTSGIFDCVCKTLFTF